MEKNKIVQPNIYFKIIKESIYSCEKKIKKAKESFLFSSQCFKIDGKIIALENGAYFTLCLLNEKLKENDLVFYLNVAISRLLKEKYNINIKSRFPNVLYVNKKIVGEVLTYRKKKWLMLSVAINLKDDFSHNVNESYFTSLNLDIDVEKFIEESYQYIINILNEDKEKVYQEYSNILINKNAKVLLNNEKTGYIKGIDLENQLIIEIDN